MECREDFVLVFGTVVIDRFREVPFWPTQGQFVEFSNEHVFLGGEAANTASHLAAWGVPVVLQCNPLGGSSEGEWLREKLRERGIRLVIEMGEVGVAPVCDVYVTPDGQRTLFGRNWDKLTFEPPSQAFTWATLDPNCGEAAREALRWVASTGGQVVAMDFLRDDEPLPRGAFWQSSTDWFGIPGDTEANARRLMDWHQGTGTHAILTDGGNTLLAAVGGELMRFEPPHNAPIVDSTGAGDAFRAGLVFGLREGWGLERAIRFAMAAGTATCGHLGGSEVIASRQHLEATIG